MSADESLVSSDDAEFGMSDHRVSVRPTLCIATGNPCRTDTVPLGKECPAHGGVCVRRLGAVIEEMIGHCALIQTLIERIECRSGPVSDKSTKTVRGTELRMIFQAATNAIRIGIKAKQ